MKITELRLHKLIASQQQQAASQSDANVAAERRAGLVFNHLMGACSLCHGSAQTTGTDYWHKVGLDASSRLKLHLHQWLQLCCVCRWRTNNAFSYHNTCAGHQHGQASTRYVAAKLFLPVHHKHSSRHCSGCIQHGKYPLPVDEHAKAWLLLRQTSQGMTAVISV